MKNAFYSLNDDLNVFNILCLWGKRSFNLCFEKLWESSDNNNDYYYNRFIAFCLGLREQVGPTRRNIHPININN